VCIDGVLMSRFLVVLFVVGAHFGCCYFWLALVLKEDEDANVDDGIVFICSRTFPFFSSFLMASRKCYVCQTFRVTFYVIASEQICIDFPSVFGYTLHLM
jgi:hypothetical protein